MLNPPQFIVTDPFIGGARDGNAPRHAALAVFLGGLPGSFSPFHFIRIGGQTHR